MEKVRQQTFYVMDYREFDKIVNKYFPNSGYEFVADEDAHNYTYIAIKSIKKINYNQWSQYDKNKWEEFLSGFGGNLFMGRLLLAWFVKEGILPEGDYLIEVFW